MKITANIDAAKILRSRGLGDSTKARMVIASEVARLSDPYVPMQQGVLKNSVQVAPDGSSITYPGPYAHYQYHGEVMAGRAPKHYTGQKIDYHGAPMRGPQWEKRMLIDHKQDIADAVAKVVGGKRR